MAFRLGTQLPIAFRVFLKMEGLKQVENALRGAPISLHDQIVKEVRKTARRVRTKSMRLVPVDTGRLKSTAYVRNIPNGAEVGYGTDYAIYVHEIPPPTGSGVVGSTSTVTATPFGVRGGFTALSSIGLGPPTSTIIPATRTVRHKPPRQWKFLERPAREEMAKLAKQGGVKFDFSGL